MPYLAPPPATPRARRRALHHHQRRALRALHRAELAASPASAARWWAATLAHMGIAADCHASMVGYRAAWLGWRAAWALAPASARALVQRRLSLPTSPALGA